MALKHVMKYYVQFLKKTRTLPPSPNNPFEKRFRKITLTPTNSNFYIL